MHTDFQLFLQDQIKTVEKHKILQERRNERERRKTQEISLLRPAQSAADESLPSLARRESEPRIMTRPRFVFLQLMAV
jgi:hypothetical protein